MSHFEQAFWSSDYAGGLGVLFAKLQQGVQENQQVLTVARMRADAEELYGQHIGDIGPATDRIPDGFSRDDGASVRKAYDGVRTEMHEAAQKHKKIASNVRELVVYPFSRWCEQHASRVQNSQDELQGRIKAHDRQADSVRKLRSHYFNKCRLVEDLEEEDKLAFKEPSSDASSPKAPTPTVKVTQELEEEEETEPVEIGDNMYPPEQIKKILIHMLESIPMKEAKVPILGTYQNVSTGSDIVEYIQKHMNGTSVSYAERMGQDLVSNGFLRLIGNVGSVFANSSRMNYQWRTKVFKITGFPEKKKGLERSGTTFSSDSVESPIVGSVGEYLAGWNPLNNPYPNETPGQKLRREAREADERYKSAVRKLDTLRCTLEEAMIEHLKFMERCELDRLKAIKSVILDFSGALSNVIPSLQSTVDKMMLFQETVQPLGDLRYLMENYRTGPFVPRVQPYENYYNSVDGKYSNILGPYHSAVADLLPEQTFGIDLEARARSDRKRVPLMITTILTHLDNNYPLLDGDEARRAIWLVDVPLAATHRLRHEINNPPTAPTPQQTTNITPDLLSRYELPIVASVLKLYLLELPDSLVSASLYEIIKTIYSNPATSSASPAETQTRISVLQNTLGQLRLANIASLDALSTHFARLVDLTSADDDYVARLTTNLASCILRTRTESALQFEEKYNARFLRDLLAHKDAIFGELKRASSLGHSASVLRAHSTIAPPSSPRSGGSTSNNGAGAGAGGAAIIPGYAATHSSSDNDSNRPRAISTDESNRRAHVEERQRAIASRSRAPSPASARDQQHAQQGPARNPRRDSSRGPETRFPVHPANHAHASRESVGSPRGRAPGQHAEGRAEKAMSLEVPGSPPPPSGHHASGGIESEGANHAAAGSAETGGGGGGVAGGMGGGLGGTPANEQHAKPFPDTPPAIDVGKRDSLGRRPPRKSAGGGVGGGTGGGTTFAPDAKRESTGSNLSGGGGGSSARASLEMNGPGGPPPPHRGVELVDRPMDD